MWKSRYEKEKLRVEELERELLLAQRRAAYTGTDSAKEAKSSAASIPEQERSAASLSQSPPSNPGSRSSSRSRGRGRGSGSDVGGGHVESPAEKMFAEHQLLFRPPPDDDDHNLKSTDVFMSHAVSDDVVGDAGIVIDNIGAVDQRDTDAPAPPPEAPPLEEDGASVTSSVASRMKKGTKLLTTPVKKVFKSTKKVLK